MNIFETARLVFISLAIKIFIQIKSLPSSYIDTFARLIAIKYISRLGIARSLTLFINPISSIRYFEFDFAYRHIGKLTTQCILDISSPRLLGTYIAYKYPRVEYRMINPDSQDVKETIFIKDALSLNNFYISQNSALKLPYKKESFDTVMSISVIEHIAGLGDKQALAEVWRVLKPSGKFILTTHIMKKSRIEFRKINQYGLATSKKKGKYFFQRIYDASSLKKRITESIGVKPTNFEIWGETEAGWFDKYIKRWIKYGLAETVYDPWYMVTKYKRYKTIDELPGLGVIGLVFKKN